ncbi:(deoxy)nucleoside triphosphate pyrophosphohydrolase [Granulicoccus sp. GXG6511]|uniref:(deoxy)nucleoside triphosphate pyrophosphohydrolase n=1 Tax=Granulicoccus sp. GXG6511 TaxID=3381351 RepID=UPI003D7EDD34
MTHESRTLVVGAAVVRHGLVLAARRRRPAGFWEFPGGKCEPGEEAVAALHRELAEELGLSVELGCEVVPDDGGTWPISAELHLRVWLARPLGVPSPGPDHDQLRWLRPADLGSVQWLPADVPIAARIADLLEDR